MTCCLQSTHGISGHLFEILEYLYYLRFIENIDASALIPFNLSQEDLRTALERYTWSLEVKTRMLELVTVNNRVRVLKCNTVIFTDGIISYRPGIVLSAKNVVLLRCAPECSSDCANVVLQDSRLYPDLPNSMHYVKKLRCQDFKKAKSPSQRVALVYATRACRKLTQDTIKEIEKMSYDKVLVLSEKPYDLPSGFENLRVPVRSMFDLCTDFVYTPVGGYCNAFDCSPRLPVECKYLGKGFKLLAPLYRGLDVRLYDLETKASTLLLEKGDPILSCL